jgi:hypothetical protein
LDHLLDEVFDLPSGASADFIGLLNLRFWKAYKLGLANAR